MNEIAKTNTNILGSSLAYGRGYVYLLQYHVVWCTKYRSNVLKGTVADDVRSHVLRTANEQGIRVAAIEVMPDHVHLLIECKPQHRLSDLVKVLKGNTARWLFMQHPGIKRKLWGGHLWNPSYCVVTVSERSAETVRKYIETQKER